MITDKSSQISEETMAQLPDEVQAQIMAERIRRQAIIDALSASVAKKIKDAVKYRESLGIEKEWAEDEDNYEGVDDANRGEQKVIKPNHPAGVVTETRSKGTGRSTVSMNITRQYVDSAAASVSELGNPTDDRNFSLRPTPVPNILAHQNNPTPIAAIAPDGQQVMATVADFAQQEIDIADKKAKAAQDRIDDWLLQCAWHAKQRRVVHDCAKIGTGVMRGPVPTIQKSKKSIVGPDGKSGLEVCIETVPASDRVSVWNVFPDPLCGESIHDGSYFSERDFVNTHALKEMKMLPGYLADQIDKVIEIGPMKGAEDKRNYGAGADLRLEKFTVWYYYGMLDKEEVEAMRIKDALDATNPTDQQTLKKLEALESCPCVVTMVNDIAIKASLNPLDSGDFPYDFITWEQRSGMPYGRGVSRIMRDAQRIVRAGLRALMDNAGWSAGIQIGIKKGMIKPLGGGAYKLQPVGFWEMDDTYEGSIKDAISFTEIPSRQTELLNVIQFGQKMAEDVTGMPLLLQGQTGSAPDTVGGMQLLNANATATRRMIARKVDDDLTEPHIRRYYDWILMYGSEDEKGDMQIDARGSQSLVERDIQRQFAIQMLAQAANPQFGIDPYKAMAATLRAEMINPKEWQYDEVIYKQNMQALSQQGSNPSVQAAQIRAASAEKIAANQLQADQNTASQHDQATIQAVQTRTQRDDEAMRMKLEADTSLRRDELALEERIAILKYATEQKLSVNAVKAQLAQTAMKLNTEKELASAAATMDAQIHVSDSMQNDAARQHDKSMQQAQFDQTNASDNAVASATTEAAATQRAHERTMQLMKQRHTSELQALQHAHDLNVASLKPAVQVPGRAGNGQALSQMPRRKPRRK